MGKSPDPFLSVVDPTSPLLLQEFPNTTRTLGFALDPKEVLGYPGPCVCNVYEKVTFVGKAFPSF